MYLCARKAHKMKLETTKTKRIKEEHKGIATILAFVLIPLSGFAIDIYIPSLPSMGTDLHLSSIDVQLTISIFLISYGVSQLFVGSIVDTFGRYKVSLVGLLLFAAASLVIANTHNIYLIYAMRMIHGITVAFIIVAKRAFFVDMFTGDKLKHYLSIFTIIWSTGPILAPFVGGYLQTAFGWQSNFYFLTGFALIMAVLEYIYSGETLKQFSTFNLSKITGIYAHMISTASFTLGLMMLGIAYSMVMIFNMTGSFIIQHRLHLTPVIAGYSSLILGLAWMTGGFIGKATLNKPFFEKLVVNLGLQVVFVVAMIVSLPFVENLYSLIFFAFIIHVTAGYTYNNYFAYSLSKFPQNAGIASGLSGGVNYIVVSLLSYLVVNMIPAKDERNLSYSYAVLIFLSAVIMFMVYKLNGKKLAEKKITNRIETEALEHS